MEHKPTLGGLKAAQAFLAQNGHAMPIFRVEIYADHQRAGFRSVAGKGRPVSINEMIRERGATSEVIDVRLSNEKGTKFVQFSDPASVSLGSIMMAYSPIGTGDRNARVLVEIPTADRKLKSFLESEKGAHFYKIVRWGKARPNIIDWIKFHLFPKRYEATVFA